MPRYRTIPPPDLPREPEWEPAPDDVLFARRMVNTVNRIRKRLYAYPIKFEPIETGEYQTEVTFECVDMEWYNVNAYRQDTEAFWQRHPTHPTSRVTMRLGPSIHRLPSGGTRFSAEVRNKLVQNRIPNRVIDDGRWYMITLALEHTLRPPVARLERLDDGSDYGEETWYSLLRLEVPSEAMEQDLAAKYNIGRAAVQAQAMLDNPEVAFVGVLNVGQGGCNALYGTDGRPFLYYDFGRAVGRSSRPDSIKPCLASAPEIVLSHWDLDHFELARSYPEARHLPWLCLEEPAGPNTGAFFRTLAHKRVWPQDRKRFEEYSWGFILRADDPGGNRNDSGLAMLVRVRDDSSAPPPGQRRALDTAGTRPEIFPDERYVLMTGDAMLQHIPSCEHHDLDGKIIGLNAVHHGSYNGMLWNEHFIPLAAEPLDDLPATVAYSYGFNRHTGTDSGDYGHPEYEAVNAYKFRGYHLRKNTNAPPSGNPAHWAPANIVLGWRRGATPPPAGHAAAAIALARGQYDATLPALRQALDDAKATFILRRAADMGANRTPIQVDAAVALAQATAAYTGLIISAGVTLQIANARLNAPLQATRDLAVAVFVALDDATYDAAVLAADQCCAHANLLAQAVVANDPAYPAVQTTHCQGAVQPVHAHGLPWPVVHPPHDAAFAVGAPPPPAPQRAISVTEAHVPTRVRHPGHGMTTGAQVTLAGSAHAAFNAPHAITSTGEDEYTIGAVLGAAAQAEHVLATRLRPPRPAQPCNIQDSGATMTVVRHGGHELQSGTQVTIANATIAAFDGVHAYRNVDNDSYAIVVPNRPHGPAGTATASGTRATEKFKELCDIDDDGDDTTTVTHRNHRMANRSRIELSRTTHEIHAGKRRITHIDADTYSIDASMDAPFTQNGVVVEGTRTRFAFAHEPVELAVGRPVSTVRFAAHGMETGDYVTIAGASDAVYAGTHRVTVINDNHFQINVGTADGALHTGQVSRHIGQFQNVPVTLQHPGYRSRVRDRNHGLSSGMSVQIQNTAHYDGAHVITVIDEDHYTIPLSTGVNRVEHGNALATAKAAAFALEPVLTSDDGNTTEIYHPGHGLPNNGQVTLVGGAHAGTHVIFRIDANRYRVAHSGGHVLVESRVTANGTAIEIADSGMGFTSVVHAGHGLATALAPNGNVVFADATVPGLNGLQAIQYVDDDTYVVALALPAGHLERHVPVTAQGSRARARWEAPQHGSPAPSEEQKRDRERDWLDHGSMIDKGRIASALAERRLGMTTPAGCTGVNCAFVNLQRT